LELDAGAQIPGGMTRANNGRTFVAQWDADSIYVALDVHQSGRPYIVTNPTSVRVTFGQYFGALPAPTGQPTSLTFLGWRFHPTSGAAVPITPTTRLTANMLRNGIVTLRANWQVQGGGGQLPTQWHTVTFDANGGTFPAGTNTQVLVQHNHTPTIATPTHPQNRPFVGWSPSGAATTSHTRIAHWGDIPGGGPQDPVQQATTITWNPNGGIWNDTNGTNNRSFVFQPHQAINPPTLRHDGHHLTGWTRTHGVAGGTTRTYRAEWSQNAGNQQIRVTFDPNGGRWASGTATGTRAWYFNVSATPTPLVALNPPPGQEFVAWDIVSGTRTTNHTLRARWRDAPGNVIPAPNNVYRIEFRAGTGAVWSQAARNMGTFNAANNSVTVTISGRNVAITGQQMFAIWCNNRLDWIGNEAMLLGPKPGSWQFTRTAWTHTGGVRLQNNTTIQGMFNAGMVPVRTGTNNHINTFVMNANWA